MVVYILPSGKCVAHAGRYCVVDAVSFGSKTAIQKLLCILTIFVCCKQYHKLFHYFIVDSFFFYRAQVCH